MGSYQWAATAANVSTRMIRYWCDANSERSIPYSDWCILQIAAGRSINIVKPSMEVTTSSRE